MWLRLSGLVSGSSSATSSRSNRRALGIRGPDRYSANADRVELGICHEQSTGFVVDYKSVAFHEMGREERRVHTWGSSLNSAGDKSSGTLLDMDRMAEAGDIPDRLDRSVAIIGWAARRITAE